MVRKLPRSLVINLANTLLRGFCLVFVVLKIHILLPTLPSWPLVVSESFT
jgi:hypothetical protein